jgi:hypothetical protein
MPIMSTRGSISVRFANHLVPKPSRTLNYQAVQSSFYDICGTYTWICPPGVTSVSVICIGAGGHGGGPSTTGSGGSGGGYAYISNYTVTP